MNRKDKQLLAEAYDQIVQEFLGGLKKAASSALGAISQVTPGAGGIATQIGSNLLKPGATSSLSSAIDAAKSGAIQATAKDFNNAAMGASVVAPQYAPALSAIGQALSKNDTASIKKSIGDYINQADPNTLKTFASMLMGGQQS